MSSLKDIKVGDPVLVSGLSIFGNDVKKLIVTGMTKTQLTLNDGSRWLKRGCKVGSNSWSREWCRPFDAEEHDSILRDAKEKQLRRKVRDDIQRAVLSLEQWERIEAILSEATK